MIVLNETNRDQEPPGLEQVRAELEGRAAAAPAKNAALTDLTAAADVERPEIEIDPSVIKGFGSDAD